MSALVDACVMFIAVCVGWIARLGAALAGRVEAICKAYLRLLLLLLIQETEVHR